ncbi:MAG TPA: hypothetical protein PKM48_03600 [Parvularculaceae bacterium]|nr:hypothetical protein [Parvularculaceae bacterium]
MQGLIRQRGRNLILQPEIVRQSNFAVILENAGANPERLQQLSDVNASGGGHVKQRPHLSGARINRGVVVPFLFRHPKSAPQPADRRKID